MKKLLLILVLALALPAWGGQYYIDWLYCTNLVMEVDATPGTNKKINQVTPGFLSIFTSPTDTPTISLWDNTGAGPCFLYFYQGNLYVTGFAGSPLAILTTGTNTADFFTGDGSGLTNVPCTTVGVTTNFAVGFADTNQTNLLHFVNGLLASVTPYSISGSKIILPGGGYLTQPGGSKLLLP